MAGQAARARARPEQAAALARLLVSRFGMTGDQDDEDVICNCIRPLSSSRRSHRRARPASR